MFTVPVPEPVTALVPVKLAQVFKGETVLYNGIFKVAEVKHGTKYVTLLVADGTVIVRKPGHETVLVERETKESQKVRGEAIYVNRFNERLREKAVEFVPNAQTKEALAKLTEHADAGYVADWSSTTQLIRAQAHDEVYGRFYTAVNYALEGNPDVNLIDFVEEYKKALLNQFTVNFRGLSKSSSQVSNLMDDARNEVIVKFLDRDNLWVL